MPQVTYLSSLSALSLARLCWQCQELWYIWAWVKIKMKKKGNNSYNFFIAFQMGASWPCIRPATFYTVFGSAFCPLRIVASQPCRPESFGLLHRTKHRTKYISCLLKLAYTKTSNNLLGWWDFVQQNLLHHHKKSNAKVCWICHCYFALLKSFVLLSPTGMCLSDTC